MASSNYDRAARRRAKRSGRERGAWIFLPADELRAAGVDPHAEPPWYRIWGDRRGGLLVRLYRDP